MTHDVSVDLERARAEFLAGVAAFEAGAPARAEAHFVASLEACPGRASTLLNLGLAQLHLGRPAPALSSLDQVLAQEPDSADALMYRGIVLGELGRAAEGVASLDRALALMPALGQAWSHRGGLLKDLGRHDEAVASLQRAIELGADVTLNRFFLAALDPAQPAPSVPPEGYVEGLFDGYAPQFESELVDGLGYGAPEQLMALLPAGQRWQRALDLGCGTGLAAPHFAPRCAVLDGVDLSPRMLDLARARGGYRHLVQAEAVEFLGRQREAHDLIVAADMLIYVGALEPLFAAVLTALVPGGMFAFTAEEAPASAATGWCLATSSRYQHREDYLRRLAASHGARWHALQRDTLRRERQGAIGGLFGVLLRD